MGTFATSKSAVKSVISERTYIGRKYKEIADNLNVRDSSNKESFTYSLKGLGIGDLKSHIGSKISGYHEFEIEIKYPNVSVVERDRNYEEFIAVVKLIVALANFNNFTSKPAYVDYDKQHSIGSFKFLFGEENLC